MKVCLLFLFTYKVVCQYPPVQRLMTPKPVSIAANRTAYIKPSLTPSGELKKTNQRIDKKHSVSMCLFSLVFEYWLNWIRINHVTYKYSTIADHTYSLWIRDDYELGHFKMAGTIIKSQVSVY